jgi:hypothetical protein
MVGSRSVFISSDTAISEIKYAACLCAATDEPVCPPYRLNIVSVNMIGVENG